MSTAAVFDRPDVIPGLPHEQVLFSEDHASGLRTIIAIHSTTLGPALGGTRFYPYADQDAALTDVLRLSGGMTYKAAIAGVPLGGGKAVIIGDPAELKTAGLLRAYGQVVENLGGRYITAGDVGIGPEDLDVVGERTSHVVGRTSAAGGSGNSGPTTALGVYQAMRAAATVRWGEPGLAGRKVGVEGVGKVGSELIALLLADGADVVACDADPDALARTTERFPEIGTTGHVLGERMDVYAPCALGGTVTAETAAAIQASVICGGANNQLQSPHIGATLSDRGVLWVPDYVANAGGLIQVSGELSGAGEAWVRERVEKIYDTVLAILDRARSDSVTPGRVADQLAGDLLAATRSAD